MQPNSIKIIECPRDAMQGWKHQIPTEQKIAYINKLLQVGFDTIDFGSFVSPKAIPQMADTKAVLAGLQLENVTSKLLAIVANKRGAEDAIQFDAIQYLGFPFSISPTFQQRNTNSSIEESLAVVEYIQNLCVANKKELVLYLSMAFGNPYGDAYDASILLEYADKIANLGITTISLADTVGVATPEQIRFVLTELIPNYANIEFGVHLHTAPTNWKTKLEAALETGCTRIDAAINGIGGCPMADDDLVGNLDTNNVLHYLNERGIENSINYTKYQEAVQLANTIFQ